MNRLKPYFKVHTLIIMYFKLLYTFIFLNIKHFFMKKISSSLLAILFMALTINIASANNDCTSSQYGQGKAPVQTNCVVSETGFQLFGILWWSNFYDGVSMCCASVMDCEKTCDGDNETVCHRV